MRYATAVVFALLAPLAAAALNPVTVVTGVVRRQADRRPFPGATVAVAGLDLAASTDRDGRYELRIPARAANGRLVEIRVTGAGLAARSAAVTLVPGFVTRDFALSSGRAETIVDARAALRADRGE